MVILLSLIKYDQTWSLLSFFYLNLINVPCLWKSCSPMLDNIPTMDMDISALMTNLITSFISRRHSRFSDVEF